MNGDSSDELTETEAGPTVRAEATPRNVRPGSFALNANRHSFQSTASSSDEDARYGDDLKTPVQSQPQRLRLKVNRGGYRRSRVGSGPSAFAADSNPSSAKGSPASFVSGGGTPQAMGQSLFAELGDMDGDEDEFGEEALDATPSRSVVGEPGSSRPGTGRKSLSGVAIAGLAPALPLAEKEMRHVVMVDSSMMTEPEVKSEESHRGLLAAAGAGAGVAGLAAAVPLMEKKEHKIEMADASIMTDPWTPEPLAPVAVEEPAPKVVVPEVNMMDSGIMTEPWEPEKIMVPVPVQQPIQKSAVPEVNMIDSGIMTEPWEPQSAPTFVAPAVVAAAADPTEYMSKAVDTGEPKADLSRSVLWNPAAATLAGGALLGGAALAAHHHGEREDDVTKSFMTNSTSESPSRSIMMDASTDDLPRPKMADAGTDGPMRPVMTDAGTDGPMRPVMTDAGTDGPVQPIMADAGTDGPVRPQMVHTASQYEQEPKSQLAMFSGVNADLQPVSHVSRMTDMGSQHDPVHEEKLDVLPVPVAMPIHDKSTREVAVSAPVSNLMPVQVPIPHLEERPKMEQLALSDIHANQQQPSAPLESPILPQESPILPASQEPYMSRNMSRDGLGIREATYVAPPVQMSDEGCQTSLSWEQIDGLLKEKARRPPTLVLGDDDRSLPTSPTRGPMSPSQLKLKKSEESIGSVVRTRSNLQSTPRRPGSATSSRRGSLTHPPLPSDHREVIAAAAQRVGSVDSIVPLTGTMGPPLAPASAYKTNPQFRPRTPSSQSQSPALHNGTTPRARFASASGRSFASTRRSSISSFASEIDERFNIRTDGTIPKGIDAGTDPRMIQAITQTMIGEYLWKYTRKAGRGEMSENRHRRYFWVHPYTRTLYWSDRDPSNAGRAESRAKSVAIEAVRVVTDDNPMPPGLHRKSLIILTPGRAVKFTATTGQRHETWFNALSYLLLRTTEGYQGTHRVTGALVPGVGEDEDEVTAEDVAEFNPGGRAPSQMSYNSRTTRNTSPGRSTSRLSSRTNEGPQLVRIR